MADRHALDQGAIWTDKNGNPHLIKDMSGAYALNAYNLLKRNAQVIGMKYAVYLSTLQMPDVDTVAFDIVEAGVFRQLDQIQSDVESWLLDKPLVKALADRVEADAVKTADVRGRDLVKLEFPDFIELPTLQTVPPVVDSPNWDYRPGDERMVFVATSGEYEDQTTVGVFVGNRRAAYRFAAEYNRYEGGADVEEWDDNSDGNYAARRYPDPYTEVKFLTSVEFDSGRIFARQTITNVRQGDDPQITVTAEQSDVRRGVSAVRVTTIGPEYKLAEVKSAHHQRVLATRNSILESTPLFPEDL